MTAPKRAPKRAKDLNTMPCWKVRVCMRGGAILHLLSRSEPQVMYANGELKDVVMECISETEYGDTVGFIDGREVAAIAWRFAPRGLPVPGADGGELRGQRKAVRRRAELAAARQSVCQHVQYDDVPATSDQHHAAGAGGRARADRVGGVDTPDENQL